jgi:hypothetical protein
MEGDALQVGVREGGFRVVGDHGGDVHRQLALPPAPDQVGEAMVLLRGQDHHPAALLRIAQPPVHGVFLGQPAQAFAQRGRLAGPGVEHHAHEEAARLLVVELHGVEDVRPTLEQRGRHARHDARLIGAGEGQDHGLGSAPNTPAKTIACALSGFAVGPSSPFVATKACR